MTANEMDLHYIVDQCQNIIVDRLKNSSPECHIMFAKDRVDETTILEVPALAKKFLPETEANIVIEAHGFLKEAVDQLCVDYHRYALTVGNLYGMRYRIPRADTDSLAPEALHKSAVRFKPKPDSTPETRVVSFRAYVSTWIRQTTQRSIPRVYVDDGQGGRSSVSREVYALNSAIREGESANRIDQVTQADTLWGEGQTVLNDPEVLETLRATYCDHLTMDEMMTLLNDPDKIEEMIEAMEQAA